MIIAIVFSEMITVHGDTITVYELSDELWIEENRRIGEEGGRRRLLRCNRLWQLETAMKMPGRIAVVQSPDNGIWGKIKPQVAVETLTLAK